MLFLLLIIDASRSFFFFPYLQQFRIASALSLWLYLTCQVIEIQTAYHLPAFDSSGAHDESSSGYYVDGKDQSFYTHDLGGGVTGSGIRESSENMTFLQTLPRSRDDSILQKIWQQKMSKAEADKLEKLERGYNASKGGFARHWHAFCAALQRLFLSQLIWQVGFLCISFSSFERNAALSIRVNSVETFIPFDGLF